MEPVPVLSYPAAMTAKRLAQIGHLLTIVGGLAIAAGAAITLQASKRFEGASSDQRRREKVAFVFGGILLAIGAGLQLIASITRELPAT